jgi:eukaryotic translation initiation factor 2C
MESVPLLSCAASKRSVFSPSMVRLIDAGAPKVFTVEGFEEKCARETKFALRRNDESGNATTRLISVEGYFHEMHNIRLRFPGLPFVKTRKPGIFFPMELCFALENQRYMHKLNDKQTSEMIRFCVKRPNERLEHIKGNVDKLNWIKDPVMQEYGMEVCKEMCKAHARILPIPTVEYGQGSQQRTFKPVGGRWDLRRKKFYDWGSISQKEGHGLKSLGVMVFESPARVLEATVKNFFRALVTSILNHGGSVITKVC